MDKLNRLFEAADIALFNLHRCMEDSMRGLEGEENWREVYGMRLNLQLQMVMAANNFAPRVTVEEDSEL